MVASSVDAVTSGVVSNLARPGGNVTGLTQMSADLLAKRLQLLGELVPQTSRLAFLSVAGIPHITGPFSEGLSTVTRSLGWSLHVVEVTPPPPYDYGAVFAEIARWRADAVYILESPRFVSDAGQIMPLALRHRLPSVFGLRQYAEAGGLLAYGPDLHELYSRAAVFVDKILRGARPGDLPMEQPTRFNLVINGTAARTLGLTIPPALLVRADQVLE